MEEVTEEPELEAMVSRLAAKRANPEDRPNPNCERRAIFLVELPDDRANNAAFPRGFPFRQREV